MVKVKGDIPPASSFGPQDAAVWGDSHGGRGVVGTSDRRGGVYGISDRRSGVSGTSARDSGVVGSGPKVGVHGICTTPASASPDIFPGVFGQGADVGVLAQGRIGLVCKSDPAGTAAAQFTGLVQVFGTVFADAIGVPPAGKHAVIPHPDGTHRALCSLECPEAWFEDFGRAELTDGRAEVAIDPDFAAVVETDDYHVFLTPEGESGALYVTAMTSTTFEVREQADGRSALSFSYRIVARPKDVEHERLAVLEIPPPREWKAPELPKEELD